MMISISGNPNGNFKIQRWKGIYDVSNVIENDWITIEN